MGESSDSPSDPPNGLGSIVLRWAPGVLLVLLFAAWLVAVRIELVSYRPPDDVETFEEFLSHMPPPSFIRVVEKDGSEALLVYGESPTWALASGPPTYAFDRKGILRAWTGDIGEAPAFMREWSSGEGRIVRLEEARAWVHEAQIGKAKSAPVPIVGKFLFAPSPGEEERPEQEKKKKVEPIILKESGSVEIPLPKGRDLVKELGEVARQVRVINLLSEKEKKLLSMRIVMALGGVGQIPNGHSIDLKKLFDPDYLTEQRDEVADLLESLIPLVDVSEDK